MTIDEVNLRFKTNILKGNFSVYNK